MPENDPLDTDVKLLLETLTDLKRKYGTVD
jgi:hypothetical protein